MRAPIILLQLLLLKYWDKSFYFVNTTYFCYILMLIFN